MIADVFATEGETPQGVVQDVCGQHMELIDDDRYNKRELLTIEHEGGVKAIATRYSIGNVGFIVIASQNGESTRYFCIPGNQASDAIKAQCAEDVMANGSSHKQPLMLLAMEAIRRGFGGK